MIIPLICSIIGTIGGLLSILVIDFFMYRKAIKNRYCKDCLWNIHKTETCLKHAYIEDFKWIWPHASPHHTCDQFKYGKCNFYKMFFHKESEEGSYSCDKAAVNAIVKRKQS